MRAAAGDCTIATSPARILAARKENCAMSAKPVSIVQVMMVVALAAVNLAVMRAAPLDSLIMPVPCWVPLGIIDFLVIWKLILTRSLRAFHYTFLIVFVVAFFVMALLVTTERLHPLGLLVRLFQQITGHKTNSNSLIVFLRFGELWMAVFLGFALAYAIGLGAAWLERHRGWDIAAFVRGSLIGCVFGSLPSIVAHAAWGGAEPLFVRWIVAVVSWVCVILGGLLGLLNKSGAPADAAGNPASRGVEYGMSGDTL
jgi:hypothetical protein